MASSLVLLQNIIANSSLRKLEKLKLLLHSQVLTI